MEVVLSVRSGYKFLVTKKAGLVFISSPLEPFASIVSQLYTSYKYEMSIVVLNGTTE
jgi:hypothetical protein